MPVRDAAGQCGEERGSISERVCVRHRNDMHCRTTRLYGSHGGLYGRGHMEAPTCVVTAVRGEEKNDRVSCFK
jgi:hypothetical protein